MANSSDLFFDSPEVSFDSSEVFFISYLGIWQIARYLFGKFLGRNSMLREEGVIGEVPQPLCNDARALCSDGRTAHPYQSWDKPHIEYLNKLLRQFIPKSSTFKDLTDADLRRFQNLLNNRPRKNLNYKTPNEVIKNIILEKLH